MGKREKSAFRSAAVCECGDHGFVGLTLGKVALFDPDQVGVVQKFTWGALNGRGLFYAISTTDRTLMHRALCGADLGQIVDHENHDTLDNRRLNLRPGTQAENAKNKRPHRGAKSRFKGVNLCSGKWQARIFSNGRSYYLGTFAREMDAAAAYDTASTQLHGEFAMTNAMLGLIPYEDSQ